MRYRILSFLVVASVAFLVAASVATANMQGTPPAAENPKTTARPKDDVALAIIVHPENSLKKVSFSELRSYLKVRRQFWPNKKRVELYLPPTSSPAYKLLLRKIYRTTHKKLQRYWTRKQFSGDIATKPSYVSSFKAAGRLTLKTKGALSVVPANRIPKGARVLLIDGKKPGDEGYALNGK